MYGQKLVSKEGKTKQNKAKVTRVLTTRKVQSSHFFSPPLLLSDAKLAPTVKMLQGQNIKS
jgi:hypothetical protein